MNTLEELKSLNVKDQSLIDYLSKISDVFVYCFKVIKKGGKTMEFNSFLVAEEGEYLDLLNYNAVSSLGKKYVIFAIGPGNEKYAIDVTNNSISCFLVSDEDDSFEEIKLAPSIKGFLQMLEKAESSF